VSRFCSPKHPPKPSYNLASGVLFWSTTGVASLTDKFICPIVQCCSPCYSNCPSKLNYGPLVAINAVHVSFWRYSVMDNGGFGGYQPPAGGGSGFRPIGDNGFGVQPLGSHSLGWRHSRHFRRESGWGSLWRSHHHSAPRWTGHALALGPVD